MINHQSYIWAIAPRWCDKAQEWPNPFGRVWRNSQFQRFGYWLHTSWVAQWFPWPSDLWAKDDILSMHLLEVTCLVIISWGYPYSIANEERIWLLRGGRSSQSENKWQGNWFRWGLRVRGRVSVLQKVVFKSSKFVSQGGQSPPRESENQFYSWSPTISWTLYQRGFPSV